MAQPNGIYFKCGTCDCERGGGHTRASRRHRHRHPGHRAEGVGGVEGEECGVVVCSRERELISRSNKKNPLWRIYERPIGSKQENRARVE